jgi:type VI secretion system (T6SS) effector TldE1-like protein
MPHGPYTIFDGYTLTLHRADGSVVGSWPAISGERGHQKPSEQVQRNLGPIPEGSYSFPLNQIQHLNRRNEIAGMIKSGQWPGSIWAWGTERAFLVPDSSTNTFKRSDFSIHGGWQPGSHGCIDLGPNEEAYFREVRRLGIPSHRLIVQYDPRLEAEAHPLASRAVFEGVTDYLNRRIGDPAVPDEKPAQAPGEQGLPNEPRGSLVPGPAYSQQQGQGVGPADFVPVAPQQFRSSGAGGSPGATPQPLGSIPPPDLPSHVLEAGNLLRANGYEITPRTMYVSHVLGPQAAVGLFKRTGSTASPAVPSPDQATGDQMRAWVRALRLGPAAQAGLVGALAPAPAAGAATPDQPDDNALAVNRPFA